MNKIFTILTALVLLTACKKETPAKDDNNASTQAKLSIEMKNMVGNEDLVLSDLKYTNAAGNLYSINMLKYYISNLTLHKKNGGNVDIKIYKLIDAALLSSSVFDIGSIDKGEYDSITFHIGIDITKNHTGVQDGDLDPSKGMFWTWNTGYIFFKHEGQFKDQLNQIKGLVLHLGTDNGFSKVKLPITLNINGDKKMRLKMDLNSVYSSPSTINFNVDNGRQSTSAADAPWIANMKANFADAFSFIDVQ